MDTILMKMTLCELLKFPDIPVKVSINEYIEISKEYSTPKSKGFINGILDKVLIDLRGSKKIVKSRSEEHTSELQSLMRISYAVFCLKKKNKKNTKTESN